MTRKPPTNGRCSTAQLEPAAHPERVPLHHMMRDQHTAGEERKRAGGEDKGHKRRETQRDKKQRPGNQTPEEETGNKDTKNNNNKTTKHAVTFSGLRVPGGGNSKIHVMNHAELQVN